MIVLLIALRFSTNSHEVIERQVFNEMDRIKGQAVAAVLAKVRQAVQIDRRIPRNIKDRILRNLADP